MKRILAVDNDKNTIETIRAALSIVPVYEIHVAYGGQEALDMMKKNDPYDLILLDLMMPEVSGVNVCQEMVKDEKLKQIPVLIVSALPVNSKAFQGSQSKFNELSVVKDVLEKPFEIDELSDKVKAIIGK